MHPEALERGGARALRLHQGHAREGSGVVLDASTGALTSIGDAPSANGPNGITFDRAATLIFSAKEAFYKCQFPLVQERLDFQDASVAVDSWGAGQGVFEIRANRPMAVARYAALPLAGRYLFHEEWITTGIAIAGAVGP